jgi:hypothetical protein
VNNVIFQLYNVIITNADVFKLVAQSYNYERDTKNSQKLPTLCDV